MRCLLVLDAWIWPPPTPQSLKESEGLGARSSEHPDGKLQGTASCSVLIVLELQGTCVRKANKQKSNVTRQVPFPAWPHMGKARISRRNHLRNKSQLVLAADV